MNSVELLELASETIAEYGLTNQDALKIANQAIKNTKRSIETIAKEDADFANDIKSEWQDYALEDFIAICEEKFDN